MHVGNIFKEPTEAYPFALNYQGVLLGADTVDTCTLSAIEEESGDDATGDVLDDTDAEILSGEATGGGVSKLIDTTKDFAALGVMAGHEFINITKNWRAVVREVRTTTNPFDTLVFNEAMPTPVEEDDLYAFYLVRAALIGGETGKTYVITWHLTTVAEYVFEDSIRMQVRDF